MVCTYKRYTLYNIGDMEEMMQGARAVFLCRDALCLLDVVCYALIAMIHIVCMHGMKNHGSDEQQTHKSF